MDHGRFGVFWFSAVMQKDLLNYYSTCIFPLKADTESGIFFYPTTLTEAFLEEEIEWVKELERFLYG